MNSTSPSDSITLIESFSFDERTTGLDVNLWEHKVVNIYTSHFGDTIGPPADKEYAVEPFGVEIIIPSPFTFETETPSIKISKLIIGDKISFDITKSLKA